MKKNYDRFLWGGVFILTGILFALNIAGVISFNIWTAIWPFIIIIIGLSIVLGDKKNFAGYFFIALGLVLFLRQQFNIQFDIKYIFAFGLILIGVFIAFFSFKQKDFPANSFKGKQNQFVVFGGRTEKITNPEYSGTNTLCLFGGHELDLRNYIFHSDIEIVATAVFGGVTIFLPHNVNIQVKSLPIFGGTENSTQNTQNNPYTVYIKATALFGGLEIRN